MVLGRTLTRKTLRTCSAPLAKCRVLRSRKSPKGCTKTGRFQSDEFEARLLCFGSARSEDLLEDALQFTWEDLFGFIFDRYQAFWRAKRHHQQWPSIGHFLWIQKKRFPERGTY